VSQRHAGKRLRNVLRRRGPDVHARGVEFLPQSSGSGSPGAQDGGLIRFRPAGPVAPRLACARLGQPEPGGGVPDFGAILGAPIRVTSAAVLPATATTPEFCDVKGPQVRRHEAPQKPPQPFCR
jgi:hypothetical protein